MKKETLRKSSPRKESEEQKREKREEKEKAKNLVDYAQKHQQTKESHKPGNLASFIAYCTISS